MPTPVSLLVVRYVVALLAPIELTRLELRRQPSVTLAIGATLAVALGSVDADLLVAGHTHGGRVRLPLFDPPVTLSRVPRAWTAGRTELASGATLIVRRGIGMEVASRRGSGSSAARKSS